MFRKLKIKIAFFIAVVCAFVMCLTTYLVYSNGMAFQKESINKNLSFTMDIDIMTNATTVAQMSNSTVFLYQDGFTTPYTEQRQYTDVIYQRIFDKIIATDSPSGKVHVGDKKIAFDSERVLYMIDGRWGIYEKYVLYDYTEISNFTSKLIYYALLSAMIALITFVVLGMFLAHFVVKPIEKSYDKEKKLVADISHELKTPVAVIMTDLGVLKNNKTKTIKTQSKWIDSIENQSIKMDLLIKEMLTLSKLDNKNSYNISEFNISSLLEQTILMLESYAYEQGVTFIYNIDPDLKYKGSQSDIAKLFSILMDNAIKYNEKNGIVKMSLYASHRKVIFKIRNTGPGIDAESINKIFNRFYREDESRATGSQTSFGLGLSIAKSIIECAKGEISVKSKPNEYTEFKVIL